jgi:putative oxidoreductase
LRRLFSTFARGSPGTGLLLMRLVAGAALIAHGVGELRTGLPIEPAILGVLAIADAALLIAGLWTPVAGFLVVTIALWAGVAEHGIPWPSILLATMGAALALLGPGGWSVDAWLFGWKRIDIER